MKEKHALILILSVLTLGIFSFTSPEQREKIVYRHKAYLGCAVSDSSYLSKADFEQLMSKSMCAKDSANNTYKVTSFEIVYAERGLYQDSAGLPIVVTDYTFGKSNGDTIPQTWINTFQERCYRGDTIYFDKVKLLGADNKSYYARKVKVVIQ